jgi:carbon storage regulator
MSGDAAGRRNAARTAIRRQHADAKETQAMLILTRKVDQGIVISGNILVRVLGVERDRVKIGISAPGEVTVLRQELWHEGEENQPFEKKSRGDGPSAASA